MRYWAKKNGRQTPLYRTWTDMWRRCTDPRRADFKFYGGRGIAVCPRWRSFAAFCADMGKRPPGMTLDRRNNDKGYSKHNCRWATRTTQSRNMTSVKLNERKVKRIRALAGHKTNVEIARQFGVTDVMISKIIRNQNWKGV